MPLEVDCAIARQVTEACRYGRGRLLTSVVADLAVKGALLGDLALAGHARAVESSFEIDVPPAGCPVALEFARSVVDRIAEPRDAVRHSDVGLRAMAREMVTTRRWAVRRTSLFTPRYRPVTRHGKSAGEKPPPPEPTGTAAAAARALQQAAGLADGRPQRPAASALAACGDLSWAVQLTVELIDSHLAWRLRDVVRG